MAFSAGIFHIHKRLKPDGTMKIVIKKKFDGNVYVGSCENIPGCYIQTRQESDISAKIRRALMLIKKNCDERNQPFPSGHDQPIFDIRIRFDELPSEQLVKFFEHQKYHLEYIDEESLILLNASYPFNRVHLPRVRNVSPLLVQKIFGEENTIFVGSGKMKLRSSVSSSA